MDSRHRYYGVACLIFGSQTYSETQRDVHIAAIILERLGSHESAEISHFTRVNKGYGECGDYKLFSVESGRFYYNSATKRLAVSTDAPLTAKAPITELLASWHARCGPPVSMPNAPS